MNRTRKWSFVEQEAQRLAGLRLSPRDIAARLDVSKSTVTRWMKAGKLGRTFERPQETDTAARSALGGSQTASQWAAAVRKSYALSATDEQVVTLAESALLMARDPAASPELRLKASRDFRAAVKDLALMARAADAQSEDEKPARAVNPPVRRTGADPRAFLMAVK